MTMNFTVAALNATFITLSLMFAVELAKQIKNDWTAVSQRKVFA